MSYQRDYDFAYTQAHNVMGLRDGGQLHNIARAFAAMRERGEPVAASFVQFSDAWRDGQIVATDARALDWHYQPDEPFTPLMHPAGCDCQRCREWVPA